MITLMTVPLIGFQSEVDSVKKVILARLERFSLWFRWKRIRKIFIAAGDTRENKWKDSAYESFNEFSLTAYESFPEFCITVGDTREKKWKASPWPELHSEASRPSGKMGSSLPWRKALSFPRKHASSFPKPTCSWTNVKCNKCMKWWL
jgi:hypothetical protein